MIENESVFSDPDKSLRKCKQTMSTAVVVERLIYLLPWGWYYQVYQLVDVHVEVQALVADIEHVGVPHAS